MTLTGRVVSQKTHSALASCTDGEDLVLLSHGRALVPRGLRLPRDARLPEPDATVRLAGACLELVHTDGSRERWLLDGPGQDLFVPLREQRQAAHRSDPSDPSCPGPALPMDSLPARTRALLGAAPAPQYMRDSEARPTFDQLELARLCSLLGELCACIRCEDSKPQHRLEEAVHGLLGLGRGSTPSGDDVLAGAAAAARALGLSGARRLCAALACLPAGSTTATGRAMLREAAAGFFVLPLATLAGAWPTPERSTVDALIGIGASSGTDMLAGFLAQTEACDAGTNSGPPCPIP